MDRGILWWLWQAFLLFSDVLRQLYSCLMLSPFCKEPPHIHQALRAPTSFQISLNTLVLPGRSPDISRSWTGSSQHSFSSFGWVHVCLLKALLSNLLWGVMFVYRACLSSRRLWEEAEQRMEIVDVSRGLHHLTNSCWRDMKKELRFSFCVPDILALFQNLVICLTA